MHVINLFYLIYTLHDIFSVQIDVSGSFAYLMAPKEDIELNNIRVCISV